jgi:UPF0271 protein
MAGLAPIIASMDIDLNCDMGEGSGQDRELMEWVTSINIACGFHAGSPPIAFDTLALAVSRGIQAGAHPSFPDRENFGRLEMQRSDEDIFCDCVYQIAALEGLARSAGTVLGHIKPHGALYNQACRDMAYAAPIARAAAQFGLPVYGLPGTPLAQACERQAGFISEGFADRRYDANGKLLPRSSDRAFVADSQEAVRQIERLIAEQGVRTICVHGDNPQALDFVKAVHAALLSAGHRLVAPGTTRPRR